MKLYMFRTVPLSIIRSFHCTHTHTAMVYVTQVCWQLASRIRMESWSCSQAVSIPVWHIPLLCVQWKTSDDGQRNCPKHVEFHSKNDLRAWQLASRIRIPPWSCSQAVSKPVWHIPLLCVCVCVQWKTPNDGQRNCPKHVEFHSKNKFEKLVHLVGFIIRNLVWYLRPNIYRRDVAWKYKLHYNVYGWISNWYRN